MYVHCYIFGGGVGDGGVDVAFDGGDVGGGRYEVTFVLDHVSTCRPSHSFLLRFVWLISAYDKNVGGTFFGWLRGMQDEVDGAGTGDAGVDTLGKATNFVCVGGVPFGAFTASEEGQ